MHVKLRDVTKSFKQSMDNGTIYFEYSNGYTIALHRSLYNCEGIDSTINLPYKKFIDCLNNDNRTIKLVKFYYKVQNLDDSANDGQNIWVDMKKVASNTSGDIYRYAYEYRTVENLQVPVQSLKSTRCIDKNYNVYVIEQQDGKVYNNETVCSFQKIHSRDRQYMETTRYNVNNPLSVKDYLKDDIKIVLKDVDIVEYDQTLKDTLVWLNGRFVELQLDNDNDKIGYIVKGMGCVDYQHVGFIGTEALVESHGKEYPVASYEPEYSRFKYAPNFDISLFKWDNVVISDWIKPFSSTNSKYYYSDNNNYNLTVKYLNKISFPNNISDTHILMCGGVIVDREDYEINDNIITLKNVREKVESVVNSAISEYGKINSILYIVGKNLPKASEFKLIQFSHKTPEIKKLILNRSKLNHKNHPYSFHVTFPKMNIGDLITLDGVYERYLLHDQNVIEYPYTSYTARYSDKNLMESTVIERIWFSESLI